MAANPNAPLHLYLVRYCFQRDRIISFLVIPELPDCDARVLLCIENRKFTFPDGHYRLRSTYSRRFDKYMPEICQVPATPEHPSAEGRTSGFRSGIRIHLGRTPEQLLGCIGLTYGGAFPGGELPAYTFQIANLKDINNLIKSYETFIHILSVPFDGTPDRPSVSADFITALVCNFPKSCNGNLTHFVREFELRAVQQDFYCRHDSPEDDAYRANLGEFYLAFCGEYPYTL